MNLQRYADAAALMLTKLRLRLKTPLGRSDSAFRAIDELTLAALEAGLYTIAVFLHERVWRARRDRGESFEALESYEHQLSAQAGVRGAQPIDLVAFGDEAVNRCPRPLLYLASWQSNAGEIDVAQRTLEYAKYLL